MKCGMAGPNGSYGAGEVVDLPIADARALIDSEQAHEVDQGIPADEPTVADDNAKEWKEPERKTEIATDEMVHVRERADKPPHRKSRRPRKGTHE